MIALDDRLVATHGIEDLWPQPDVADHADAVARFGDRDAVSLPRHLLEHRQHLRVHRRDQGGSLGGDPLRRHGELRGFRRHRAAVHIHGLLLGGELRFGTFEPGGEIVGLEHAFENLFLERLHLVLGGFDLVLHRLIFAVGLHRHQLIAKLRKAALLDGHVLLDDTPHALILHEALFGRGDELPHRFEPCLECLLPLRLVGQTALCVACGRVEPLEDDEAFEISVH